MKQEELYEIDPKIKPVELVSGLAPKCNFLNADAYYFNLLCSILFITFVTLVFGYGKVTLRVSGTFIAVCTLREGGCCHQTTSSLRKKIRGKKKMGHSGDVLMIQKKYLEYILKLDTWPTEGFPVAAEHQAPVRSIRASIPFLARSG